MRPAGGRGHASQSSGFSPTDAQREIDAYQVVDLNAGVDFGRVTLDVFARNLFDSRGVTSVGGLTTFGLPTNPNGAIGTSIVRPRTIGATLGFEF